MKRLNKNYIREGNILLTIIYNAGFGVAWNKKEQHFLLYDRDCLLKSSEKKCNSLKEISEIKRS
jgi:hypothetical protein